MKAYALIDEDELMYAIVFDKELAHEIASEYNFDIEVHDLDTDHEVLN